MIDKAADPIGRPRSENLKQAETDLSTSEAMLKTGTEDLTRLLAELESGSAELVRLEGLYEPTQKEIHQQELLRRKLRRLDGDIDATRDLVNEAQAAVDKAERKHAVARLADIDADLVEMDAAYLADIRATEKRLAERRAKVFAKLREAHELNFWLRPGSHWTHRGALSGIPAEGVFEFVAGQETIDRAAALERQRLQNAPERN